MGLLSLLPIAGFALLAARQLGSGIAVALLQAVSAIVLVAFLGGLLGLLWPTAVALHLGGVGVLGYECWRLHRERAPLQPYMPIGVLVVSTLLVYLVHGSSQYFYYDEFAHWGVYIKEMLAFDGFWQADTNSMHPRYPPAAPLWLYFFEVFGEYSEGMAYVAQFVLLLTPLLVLWERLTWRQWPWALLIIAICLLLIVNFGLGVNSLYVDPVIGAWFVGTILCFLFESPGPRKALVFALPVTVLALLKESSLEFALAAAGTLAVLTGLQTWRSSHRIVPAGRHGVVAGLVLAAAAALALQTWSLHLERIGAPEDHEAVGDIVSGLAGNDESVDAADGAEITRRFVEVFVGQQLANDGVSRQFNAFSYSLFDLNWERYRLSTLGLFVLFPVWWAILLAFGMRGSDRLRWAAAAACVALTGAAYVCAVYLRYRYALGDYGLALSSYTRYVNTIALPMLIVAFAPLLPAFRSAGAVPALRFARRSVPLPSLLAVLGCVGLYVFETPYLRPVVEPNPAMTLRQQLEPAASGIRDLAGRTPVWVYLPDDRSNEFIGHFIQYLMAPTPAIIERDPAFLDRAGMEILEAWASFGYLWIVSELDAPAAERFVAMTGLAPSERLFAVGSDENGKLVLAPVGSDD